MKIFISHSSKNKFYGDKLVDLLRLIGIKEKEIIYTSNSAYGIPVGSNIFTWLKAQISEKPFVIYLLSEEYYQSIACLNEMGAAWVIENKHIAIFTPTFDLSSKEFQNGALDPRELGFYITNKERILSFIENLPEDFQVSKSHILIAQTVEKFLTDINTIHEAEIARHTATSGAFSIQEQPLTLKKIINSESVKTFDTNQTDLFSKFVGLIKSGSLKDDELILLHYIMDTGRSKLMTGWQEQSEINNIEKWESINQIDNKLSVNYSSTLRKFEARGFTDVSALTGSGNPKEFKIKNDISSRLFDLPDDVTSVIMERVKKIRMNI